jgi:pimeloyl-[acyl-carrier protein] methyl ester esterase
MIPILFVHGWGFDAEFWRPVITRLPDHGALAVDLGFFNRPRRPEIARTPLVVGHSMGFAWALAKLPRPWAGAMAVNGFPRFTAAADFPAGIAPPRLARMRAQFERNPEATTRGFLADVGHSGADLTGLRADLLGDALAFLSACDERKAMAALGCPLLALAGGRDPLVSVAMTRAGFDCCDLDILDEGDHLLPLGHADWVAARIATFARGLT